MNWGKGKTLFASSLVITIAVLVFSIKPVKAACDHIVINEIYAVSSSSDQHDWIELFNPTNDDIDLSDYFLVDDELSSKAFYLSSTLKSHDFLVVEKITGGFTFDLSSTDETLFLKFDAGATDQIIDQVSYEQTFKTGISLSRIPNGSDSNIDMDDFRYIAQTKFEENILPVFSNEIIINEILAKPLTSPADEFIELYNTGQVDIDLSGWQLDDIINGGSSPYTIPNDTIIPALSYLSFYSSDTGISLNDTGDTARLIDPNSEEKSKVIYALAKRGQSYSLFGNIWQWTVSLTPGAANILTLESEEVTTDIQIIETDIFGAREQPDEVVVSVTGIVTVLPGKLSSQYFYIQNQFSGIQIYNYSKDFPLLNLGDEIRITGELDTVSGERRIKIASANDIKILSTHPPPEPIEIKIDDIEESYEGEYVEVIGIVSKTSGNTFYVHGSGEIQIVIRSGTGIKKPRMKVGDRVKIAGILSKYNDSYRILPTKQNDVKIISSSKLASTGPDCNISIISALIATIISWIISARVSGKQKI